MPSTNMGKYFMSTIYILLNVILGTLTMNYEGMTVESVCDYNCTCENKGSDFLVDCSRRNLTVVPSNFPSKTTILDLHENEIAEIGADALSGIANLTKLYLQQNRLRSLPENLLQSAKGLLTFHVQKNNLSELPPNLFTSNRQIKDINLSVNKLKVMPQTLLDTAACLFKLDISSNLLEELDEKLFYKTPNLKLLYVQENYLRVLPRGLFTQMTNLTGLYLGSNRIGKLPQQIFHQTQNLSYLYVSNNRLEQLNPTLFSNTPNLAFASFKNNSLLGIPQDLFALTPNIKRIDFSYNKITSLNESTFFKSSKLFILHLERNSLTNIPENLLAFTNNLDKIDLSYNNLQTLPNRLFANVTKLSYLHLAGNNICSLPPSLFDNLSTLQSIDLSFNSLSDIPGTLLADTENLTSFHVAVNKVRRLPDGLFFTTPKLTNISFSSNKLTDIPESIFNATPNLSMIDFVDNRLTELPIHLFETVHELKYLQMSANRIKSIDSDLFSKVRLMEEMDFSNNSLSSIPDGLFTSNVKAHQLRTIFLQRNNIAYIQMDAFNGLPNLLVICLFDNRINAIDDDAFAIKSLRKLFLFNNDLQNLTNSSFATSSLQEIHLYGNNITNISRTATKGIPTQPIWFLSCELLRNLEASNIKLECINENFAPGLRVDDPVSRRLKSEGFTCAKVKYTKDLYQCELCKPGTYTYGDNHCYPCPRGGFFQDAIGFKSSSNSKMGCKRCNNGTFVKFGGGSSAEDCEVCPDGTNKSMPAGFRACFCKDGYARTDRFGPCYRCNQTGLNCSGLQDYQSIMKGYYWYWKFPGADNDEYKKFVKNLLNESQDFDNNTFYAKQMPRVFKCPRPDSCNTNQTGDAPVHGTCSEGYFGWLCNKCDRGYFSLLKKCVKCPRKMILLVEAFFTTALSVTICYLIWTQYAKHKKQNTDERNLLDIIVSRFKICLGFYQVLGEFFSSVQEASWMGMFNFMGEIFSYITLNILRIFFRPQCLQESFHFNPKIQFLIALLVIFFLTLFPVFLYLMKKAYLKKTCTPVDIQFKLKVLKAKISTVSLVLLFLTYPPICTAIFQMYRRSCVVFCADLKNQSCQVVLRSDYQLRCDDLIVYQVLAYLATIGYIVAFPLVLYYLLRKYCSPKMTTVLVDSGTVNGDTAPLLAVECDHIKVPIGLKFLCENYKPQFWYWEIIELTRKVAQTVLLTLLGWEDKVTILLTIGVSVSFLTLHARYRPMKSVLEQRLQMFSLTVILINVLVATISMAVPEEFEPKLAILILLLNVSVVVIITIEALVGVIRKTRRLKMYRKIPEPQRLQQMPSDDTLNMEEK